MANKQFTMSDAFEVQTDDLERWRAVLKPEVFAAVQVELERQNNNLPRLQDPSDVWRGNDITEFVVNLSTSLAAVPAEKR